MDPKDFPSVTYRCPIWCPVTARTDKPPNRLPHLTQRDEELSKLFEKPTWFVRRSSTTDYNKKKKKNYNFDFGRLFDVNRSINIIN